MGISLNSDEQVENNEDLAEHESVVKRIGTGFLYGLGTIGFGLISTLAAHDAYSLYGCKGDDDRFLYRIRSGIHFIECACVSYYCGEKFVDILNGVPLEDI